VAAYEYAAGVLDDDGNPPPKPFELTLLGYIDRFGVTAATGRETLQVGEMRRMILCENIHNAYLSRKASDDWAKWATDNPFYAVLLREVEGLLDAD